MDKSIHFEDSGPSLTPEQISAFEKRLGGQLPDDYKQFLLAHNGGICEPELGLAWKGEVEHFDYFDALLPITEEEGGLWNNLVRLRKLNPDEVDGYLPIAGSFGGLDICLAYKGPRAGAVFITEYEYKVVFIRDLVPKDVTMVPLADSFTDLFDQMVLIPTPYCPIVELGKQGTVEDLERYLAEGHSIDTESKSGFSILCEAIKYENQPMLEACIERGASLSQSVKVAVRSDCLELLPKLVNAGADVNERDEFGRTPLQHVPGTALPGAEGARNRQVFEMLVNLGAREVRCPSCTQILKSPSASECENCGFDWRNRTYKEDR